jgi:hypothetical protein
MEVIRRHEPRVDDDAAGEDAEVVVPVAEGQTAHLHELQPPPRRSVQRRVALQLHDAVRHALELHVVHVRGAVVEEEDGDVTPGEELLQRQDLLPIAQRALREETDLRQRVEDDAVGLEPLDLGEEAFDRLPQLHFGGVEDRGLVFFETVLTDELFVDVDVADVPPVRARHGSQFVARFRQRDVHRRLAVPHAFEEKLQPESRLADSRITLQQIRRDRAENRPGECDPDLRCRSPQLPRFSRLRTPKSESSEGSKSRNPASCGDRQITGLAAALPPSRPR